MLEPQIREVLDGTPIAHLATVLPDGSPHTVPLWIGTSRDQIIFFTGPDSRKAKNLHRDPRVAISIAPADDPFTPIVIRGRVVRWIDGDEGWQIIDEVATKYIGSPYPRDNPRAVAVVEPERQRVGIG